MVQVKEVSFSYKKKEALLKGLQLELYPNKIYGLFGLNGTGKTTLLNLIAGMLFPKSGTCTLNGEETKKRSPKTMSRLYIVPEQFELPPITGIQFVELHKGFYPDFDEEQFDGILSIFEVNISEKLTELSFGQQKKFAIAFAIATQTGLLILDEPTNGLDIPSKSQFRKILASLDTENRCIIISTHQVRDLGTMIDHVSILKDGSIVFNHSVEEIRKRLAFQKLEDGSSQQYIYGEETLGGMNAIVAGSDKQSEELDLELLFNGIISETEKLNEALS